MTVCIAAICQQNGEPRIVLCSDTRATSNTMTDDSVLKVDILGYNWAALLAGYLPGVQTLSERIAATFQRSVDTGESPGKETLMRAARIAISLFMASTDFLKSQQYDMLLTGFDNGVPSITRVCVHDGVTDPIFACYMRASIGCGDVVVDALLHQRGLGGNESVERAIYLVYEAKRFSESVNGVGPHTLIGIQKPNQTSRYDQVDVRNINSAGLTVLEDGYKRFGLQPIPAVLAPFPEAMFFTKD